MRTGKPYPWGKVVGVRNEWLYTFNPPRVLRGVQGHGLLTKHYLYEMYNIFTKLVYLNII
jgi:hypothetical protein